jgi:hypothetical protein
MTLMQFCIVVAVVVVLDIVMEPQEVVVPV